MKRRLADGYGYLRHSRQQISDFVCKLDKTPENEQASTKRCIPLASSSFVYPIGISTLLTQKTTTTTDSLESSERLSFRIWIHCKASSVVGEADARSEFWRRLQLEFCSFVAFVKRWLTHGSVLFCNMMSHDICSGTGEVHGNLSETRCFGDSATNGKAQRANLQGFTLKLRPRMRFSAGLPHDIWLFPIYFLVSHKTNLPQTRDTPEKQREKLDTERSWSEKLRARNI